MTEKNIHEAIVAIMKEVGFVKKEKAQNLNYSFASESALIQALRPSMLDHGVYMFVKEIRSVRRDQYESKGGSNMTNTSLDGVVCFYHAPTTTSIDVMSCGEGADAGDKSQNKALTGMYKYALRQTFCIETGDDPDKHPSEEQERAPMTEGEKKKIVLTKFGELKKRADAVKLEIPSMDGGWDSEKMKAHYNEQKHFVEQAEQQARQ